jgi:hypothetical protein
MLYGTVTNERQRQHFQHPSGTLDFGRLPSTESACVVIDDTHVSRQQLRVEEVADRKVRLENTGRSTVFFRDGTRLGPQESDDREMPIHLTVGHSVIEFSFEPLHISSARASGTLAVDQFDDVVFLTLGDSTLDFQFPMAIGYRQLTGFATYTERYKELLRLGENLIAFVASTMLALLDTERLMALNKKLSGPALGYWKGGISPGNWLDFCIHATLQMAEQEENELTKHFIKLQMHKEKKGSLGETFRKLLRAKNDFKHDRGPSVESEYHQACITVSDLLNRAFDSLGFLKSHTLYLVRDVNPHRRGNLADIVLLKCMGGNPGFLTEQRVQPPTFRKGDLYLQITSSEFVPLYPFLHTKIAEQSKSREFYFIDRLDFEGKSDSGNRRCIAGLKSFDRGSMEKDEDVGAEMQSLFAEEQ